MSADANTKAEYAKNWSRKYRNWLGSIVGPERTNTITNHACTGEGERRGEGSCHFEYVIKRKEKSVSRTLQFIGVVTLKPTKIVMTAIRAERRQPEYIYKQEQSQSIASIWTRLVGLTHIDQR